MLEHRPTLLQLVVLALLTGTGCRSQSPITIDVKHAPPPSVSGSKLITPGVRFEEVQVPRENGLKSRLWVYLPDPLPKTKIPCVVIAPAGTRLFHGIGLGDGDRPEHIPYVRAGMAVVAYEIDGALDEKDSENERAMLDAAGAFMRAEAGLANARSAIEYATTRTPAVDPKRIYTAGHSSAATLSLLTAENDERVAACIAYAPCSDVEARLGPEGIQAFNTFIPGFASSITRSSPKNRAPKLRCPLFLFHANDDSNVPVSETAAFAAQVKQTNHLVTFVHVPTGGHYDPMVSQGIPQAIQWLQALPSSGQRTN